MEPVLLALAEAALSSPEKVRAVAAENGLRVVEDRVQVYVFIQPSGQERVVQRIRDAGGEVTKTAHDATFLQAWLPLRALERIGALSEVRLLRRPVVFQPVSGSELTQVIGLGTTEGLGVMNADAWQAKGFLGSGVKVAIVDVGFQGYNQLVQSGDLPAGAILKNFVDGESDAQVDGTYVHGAASAEIVHDIAPAAQLYLVKVSTNADVQQAVDWLITQQVRIVSFALNKVQEGGAGDGTGFLKPIIDKAQANGILWINSAGDYRRLHWSGTFLDPDGNGLLNYTNTMQNDLNRIVDSNGNPAQIPAGSELRIELRWNDWLNPTNDYDLLLWKEEPNGSLTPVPIDMGEGQDLQDGSRGQIPFELIYETLEETGTYVIAIQRFLAVQTQFNFDLFVSVTESKERMLSNMTAARSIEPPADIASVMSVAAVEVAAPHPQSFYSSEGPANGPGGAAVGGLLKPDIAAYANVTTQTKLGARGTGVATAHVAGAGALLLSLNPGLTPLQLRQQLELNTVDMGVAGKDPIFGAGRLKLGAPPTLVFSDDFETDKGWKANFQGTDTATSGKWERGDPEQTLVPNSPTVFQVGTTPSGVNSLVTGRLNGGNWQANDVDNGKTTIRSPPIALPAGKKVKLLFMSYLANDPNAAASGDLLQLRVHPTGGPSSIVYKEPGASGFKFGSWKGNSVELGAFAGKTIQLEFEAVDGAPGNVIEAAVDDVVIIVQ